MWLRSYQVLMGSFFFVSIAVIVGTSVQRLEKGERMPAPVEVPMRLTNMEFYASELQRALIRKLNGTLVLEGAGPVYVESPAFPEETMQLCKELTFGLPWAVTCEPTRIGLEASPFAGGRLVLNHWYRQREGKRQEFLEMGLLLTECSDDLCVPLGGGNVQFAPAVEGEDQRGGLAK